MWEGAGRGWFRRGSWGWCSPTSTWVHSEGSGFGGWEPDLRCGRQHKFMRVLHGGGGSRGWGPLVARAWACHQGSPTLPSEGRINAQELMQYYFPQVPTPETILILLLQGLTYSHAGRTMQPQSADTQQWSCLARNVGLARQDTHPIAPFHTL